MSVQSETRYCDAANQKPCDGPEPVSSEAGNQVTDSQDGFIVRPVIVVDSPVQRQGTKQPENSQVRSGVGTHAGAARRRVHLVTLLLRPPSGHRPGRHQARHVRILQRGLRLAIAQADAMLISFR